MEANMDKKVLVEANFEELIKYVEGKKIWMWHTFATFLFVLSTIITVVCRWASVTFGVGINEIVNTLLSPLQGTESSTVISAITFCLPPILAVFTVCIVFAVQQWRERKRIAKETEAEKIKQVLRRRAKLHWGVMSAGVLFFMGALFYVNLTYNVVGYIKAKFFYSKIYEENYVSPLDVSITPEGQVKNLICIYLESMETTYASVEDGGAQEINYIPNLTQLAKDNISFSNSGGLGGLHSAYGTGWTMGALFATTSGVPFAFPVEGNAMQEEDTFASGIITLGDFLQSRGYTQEFLCGSDATFAGRKTYYEQHGAYDIFDYYTAIQKGYIAPDYAVWWGFEDQILYKIAKDEALRLSAEGKAFNLTFLTADTHHIDGYVCSLCKDDYPEQTANVVACADRQIADFISWCQQQDFYNNTTIVIVGDHPRMDTSLVSNVLPEDRMVYNCFINANYNKEVKITYRDATSMDMFPTILSAMGYQIEGNRLGLGTNLFSDRYTLPEKMGYKKFNTQLSENSKYYTSHFAPELEIASSESSTSQ